MIPKSKQKQIAKERIEFLFKEAKKISKKDLNLSNRYVALARKISMRQKVKIPKEFKKLFCKHCNKFLAPGKTLIARIKKKKLIYHCLSCNKIIRYPFSRRKT